MEGQWFTRNQPANLHPPLSYKGVRAMGEHTDAGRRLLTRAEVAAIFQVSPSTITRWAEAGKLPVAKTLGGHRRYDAASVEALAQQLSPNTQFHIKISQVNEEAMMTKTVIDVPAMYGDHHVLEVRQILLAIPGVQAVNASSAFKAVEIEFDAAQNSIEALSAALAEAGYLETLPMPLESEIAVTLLSDDDRAAAFRHTTAFEQAKDVVSFAHAVPQSAQRALWPCPGVGLLNIDGKQKEINHG